MSLGVIIVAAGSSQRMGFDKLMHPLGNKPVLQHSLNAFQNSPLVNQVILVTTQQRFEQLEVNSKVTRVDGGSERHHSVLAGIEALNQDLDYIAVHDGARPLISQSQITEVLSSAKINKAAASAKRITDTVKRSDADGFVNQSISRENLWAMETPQIFSAEKLLQAYRHIEQSGQLVTDEVSALELIQVQTILVANTTPNPKITFPEDIPMAELQLSARV